MRMQDDASQKMTFIINFPKDAGTACSKNNPPFQIRLYLFLLTNLQTSEKKLSDIVVAYIYIWYQFQESTITFASVCMNWIFS